MRIISGETRSVRTDVLAVLAGVAVAVSGVGALLALTGQASPLRAPFALLYLFATPAAALSASLSASVPGMEWPARLVVSAAGSLAVNALVAQAFFEPDSRSAPHGVLIISLMALIIFLPARLPKRRKARANRKSQFRARM